MMTKIKHPPSRCFSINRWICIKKIRPASKSYFKTTEKNVHIRKKKSSSRKSVWVWNENTILTTHSPFLGSHSPYVQRPTHHIQGVVVFISNWRCGLNDGIYDMRIYTVSSHWHKSRMKKNTFDGSGCVKACFFVPVSRLQTLILWHDTKIKLS